MGRRIIEMLVESRTYYSISSHGPNGGLVATVLSERETLSYLQRTRECLSELYVTEWYGDGSDDDELIKQMTTEEWVYDHTPKPKTKLGKIASFIFGYLYENRFISPRSITIGCVYDDELLFFEAFEREFPGRNPYNSHATKRRLAKYMNQLCRDGWLIKGRRYNDAQYMGEPRSGFYPMYCLPQSSASKLKTGAWTPDGMGHRYAG